MVTLRSIRTYALNTFQDVTKALAFLERSIQDALDSLSAQKADYISVLRTDKATDEVEYNQHVFSSGNRVNLPSAAKEGQYVGVSNVGASTITIYPSGSDTILGSTTNNLLVRRTLRLTSDGNKGWW